MFTEQKFLSADLASQGEGRSSFGVPDAASVISGTLESMGYELVEMEFGQRGLLRVYIDAPAGIRLEDCEKVSRQLNHLLTVENIQYDRLEVSSPGLDRPLRTEADYERFAGCEISLTLKLPFQGRKVWKGVLGRGEDGRWQVLFLDGKTEQVLGFGFDEVREARLVPVVDFKGRRGRQNAPGEVLDGKV